MSFKKTALAIIVFFTGVTCTIAQSNLAIVKGKFKEKSYAEVQLSEWVNGKQHNSFRYKIDPANPDFALAIPVNEASTYKLLVRLMSDGEKNLEIPKQFTFPLKLVAGQNMHVGITPSKLDTVNKKGLDIKNDPGKLTLATIKGSSANWNPGANISLARVANGYLQEVSNLNFPVNKSSNLSFVFVLPVKEEGFYYLLSPTWRTRIYLKPSDKLEVTIDGKTGICDIINGSEENGWVSKWHRLAMPITELGYNKTTLDTTVSLAGYESRYEKLQPAIKNFIQSFKTGNARFNRLFKTAVDIDRQLAPIYFLAYKNEQYKLSFSFSEYRFAGFHSVPDFYKQFIAQDKLYDAGILKVGEGNRFMNMYLKLDFALLPENQRKQLSKAERLKGMINRITNDTLKSFFFMDQMGDIAINNLTEFRTIFEPLKMYAKFPVVKKRYEELGSQFISDTAWLGKSSYDFSLPDTAGKMVSMKDFKGKVIFIDVWATWCSPCRKQVPFLKEIEEEYKGNKDMVFMAISTDSEKNKQKWLDFIKKEKLVGIHLLDDVGKSFAEKYGINAIPRFLLIDKQGNWIDVRMPRPEDKEDLKKYLDDALADKAI